MTPDEIKRWEQQLKTTDGLFRRVLQLQAWCITLYERIAELESKQSGIPAEELPAGLSRRQKQYYQKLLERVEATDPGYAAELDDRPLEDLL